MIFNSKKIMGGLRGDSGGGVGDGFDGVNCGLSGKSCFVKVSIESNHK